MVRRWSARRPWGLAALVLAFAFSVAPAAALPEIRTQAGNAVPACVTPARLMHFMAARNAILEPRFRDIARLYRQHGEALRIRWDYAFFQMLLETNYLTFRTGSGGWGDVKPAQNNFAGLGTTGGACPATAFPTCRRACWRSSSTWWPTPASRSPMPRRAARASEQEDIIEVSRKLGRAVTFRDLTRRWAVDRRYAQSIEAIAERYRGAYCTGQAIAGLGDDDDRRGKLAPPIRGRPSRGTIPSMPSMRHP